MTQYACVKCTEPLGDWCDPYCPICEDDTLAVEVLEPGITRDQYIEICRHFKAQGENHKLTRMRRLSKFTGRTIHDYWDVTQTEAAQLLEEWADGVRH